jgi:hypothetical protein
MKRTNDFSPTFFSRSNNSSASDVEQGRKGFNAHVARKAMDIGSGLLEVSKAIVAFDVNDYSRIKR